MMSVKSRNLRSSHVRYIWENLETGSLHSEWLYLDKSAGRSPLWTVSLSSYGDCSCPAMDFFPSLKLTNKMPLKNQPVTPKRKGWGCPTPRQTHHVKKNIPSPNWKVAVRRLKCAASRHKLGTFLNNVAMATRPLPPAPQKPFRRLSPTAADLAVCKLKTA